MFSGGGMDDEQWEDYYRESLVRRPPTWKPSRTFLARHREAERALIAWLGYTPSGNIRLAYPLGRLAQKVRRRRSVVHSHSGKPIKG